MVNDLAAQFCLVIVGILIAVLIGSFILKWSCVLFDFFAGVKGQPVGPTAPVIKPPAELTSKEGGDDEESADEIVAALPGVRIPTFEWAMRMIFFATLVNTSGSFIIFQFVRLVGVTAGRGVLTNLSIFLISSPCGILVLAGICAAMLPTHFGKGLLVSLLFHFLVVLLAAAVAAVVYLLALSFGQPIPWFS